MKGVINPMKAWQFTKTGKGLSLQDVAAPRPKAGEVVVDIKAAGLCHTDVSILDDSALLSRLGAVPLTLGHEVSGVISEVNDEVTHYSIGDRVAISPAGQTRPGLGRNGGYSFKCTALPEDLARIPDGVDFSTAAVGTCAGRAAYRAVIQRGQVKPGDKVGIIGLGGLGQIGARIAVLKGAKVYAAEIRKPAWSLAHDIGISNIKQDISAFEDIELDLIIDFAGFGTTTAAAIQTVRPFGTVVQVGMGRMEASIPTDALILKQVTLLGSRQGTVSDIEAVYELVKDGELNPKITKIDFDHIPEGIQKLRAGSVTGRLVAEMRKY